MAPSSPPVNHHLFADDSLLFFKASVNGEEELPNLLNTYCMASGQRVKRDKSSIFFSKGCPQIVKDVVKVVFMFLMNPLVTDIWGCQLMLATPKEALSNI